MTHGCYWYKELLRSSVKCSQPLTSEGLIQSKLYMFYKHWGLGTAQPMSMDGSQCPQSSRMWECPTTTEPGLTPLKCGFSTWLPTWGKVEKEAPLTIALSATGFTLRTKCLNRCSEMTQKKCWIGICMLHRNGPYSTSAGHKKRIRHILSFKW